MLKAEWVRYGREAAGALRAALAGTKADEPLAPVTVVVPSNHVGVGTRRLLASGALGPVCGKGTGLAAVTFVTPYRLAELLGAPRLAAMNRRPVSTPVIAAALRSALNEDPGLFEPVAAHPATETALVAAYRELRDITDDALDALAATSDRAGDVVRLHRAARTRLEPDWYDEEDLMVAAADAIKAGDRITQDLGALILYLPPRLSCHAAMLLAAAAERSDLTVIAGTTGDARADADVITSLKRLGVSDPSPPPVDGSTTANTRIVTASDADDEVRAAVRAVVDAARDGTLLDRIAILHASPEPYARLLHEQLAAAGIGLNGAAVTPAAAHMAGRTLLQLLALPEANFRRQDVFAWLAAAPVHHDGKRVPVAAWERLSRDAGVVARSDDWDKRLATLADDLDLQAHDAEADPDRPDWKAERKHADAERARDLRAFALGLIDDLSQAAATPRPWGARAKWARQRLGELLGGDNSRGHWPKDEQKAADRVDRAIDRLAALDGVEGPVGLDVFTHTLQLELEDDLQRTGRFGEGVLVGSIAMGVGLDLDLVIVLGLAEGSFPAAVHDDSLLPDHEREAAHGQLPLRRQRIDREHHDLLATLAGARRHLLGVPRGDLRQSSQRIPSRWVLDIASALAGRRLWSKDLLEAHEPWIEHIPSFAAGLRHLDWPATAQEHRLRALMAGDRIHTDATLTAGMTVITERRSDRFTRFDGNLGHRGLAITSPVDQPVSPTGLQDWAVCPYAYLVERLLRAKRVENPEEHLRITALDKGSLIHQALELFILDVLKRDRQDQPGPDEPWTADDRRHMTGIAEDLFIRYQARGLTGRPIFWQRDRATILADLQKFLDADSEYRRTKQTWPQAAELEFDAVPITLNDGRVLMFRGKADRVDRGLDGTLHILDYKSGKADDYKALTEQNPDERGTMLQLPVYGAAARVHLEAPEAPVIAEYWFVTSRGKFERYGYRVSDEVLSRFGQTLGKIVTGIEGGNFPPHPREKETSTALWISCHYCDPDGLGVVELRRQWERKRHDPALAPYAELAEPLAGVTPEVEELAGG